MTDEEREDLAAWLLRCVGPALQPGRLGAAMRRAGVETIGGIPTAEHGPVVVAIEGSAILVVRGGPTVRADVAPLGRGER